MNVLKSSRMALVSLFVGALLLVGCSTLPRTFPDTEPPQRPAEKVLDPDKTYPLQVYDPIQGFNRGVYRFNYYFDKFLFIPVVRTYEFILPDYVEDRVSNFVDNVFEFNNLTNNILQLKMKATGITVGRWVVNSTVGILGLWDPATGWGMREQKEDFGQTLGHYGVGHGPYIVLPILGPSNLRDTVGFVGDSASFSYLGPPAWIDDDTTTLVFTAVSAVDQRHRQPFRYYGTGSPFEYETVRLLYTKKREIDIAD